jgi:hypothetical protein
MDGQSVEVRYISAQQMAIAGVRHPSSARQMALMSPLSPRQVFLRICVPTASNKNPSDAMNYYQPKQSSAQSTVRRRNEPSRN